MIYSMFVFKSTNLLNKQKIIVSIIDDSNLAGRADFIVEIYIFLGVAWNKKNSSNVKNCAESDNLYHYSDAEGHEHFY